jgi:malate dehydrogenase (oxaloacetate-decarboxylating)
VLIQFEDFAQPNAMPLLQRHRDRVCCFNDDIQGTAAVTLGSLLSACRKKGQALREQRIVFVGSGSAGCGIAELIISAMINEGLSEQEARGRIYMVDRQGLLTAGMTNLLDFQERLAHPQSDITNWRLNENSAYPSLPDVVANVKPSILIGVSGKAGLFTESLIRLMHANCPQPIIFPLSNPSLHVEANPVDVIKWTEGAALVATGSPFEPVVYGGNSYYISQCNNSYVFPGIGLGIIACSARLVSDEMLMVASTTLAKIASEQEEQPGAILPPLTSLSYISRRIAFQVAKKAQEQALAREMSDEELLFAIERNFWKPAYRDYRRIASRAR